MNPQSTVTLKNQNDAKKRKTGDVPEASHGTEGLTPKQGQPYDYSHAAQPAVGPTFSLSGCG